jgi:2-amino-4-hydroxy-6-hydroxymethyldihydropteridine diphosphokinase
MILIALGANIVSRAGRPAQTLHAAIAEFWREGISTPAVSPFYETPAWPDPGDPPFVNAVIRIETSLASAALLALLQRIEKDFGRVRQMRNAPRTLDLDIIDYDGRIEGGPPVLPHPRIESRGFVLIPLRDVAPAWRHPVSGRSVAELIADLPQESRSARRL